MSNSTGVLLSIFFGYVPMLLFAAWVYWLDRYEKEPGTLLGIVFHWGALVAAGGAYILNTLVGVSFYALTGSEQAAEFSTTVLSAPIVEESLKGLAVLFIFLLARREFDSILDGIIYAAITALGFAATENALYIYSYGFAENGLTGLLAMVFVRVVMVGWQHPFYTAFIGIGLAKARLTSSPSKKLLYPILGWVAAILLHAIHNGIAGMTSNAAGQLFASAIDWSGWIALLAYVLVMQNHERRMLAQYLEEEIALQTLSPEQFRLVCSSFNRTTARWKLIGRPQYRSAGTFYQLCGELAHKKRQCELLGDERGNIQLVTDLREQVRQISLQTGL